MVPLPRNGPHISAVAQTQVDARSKRKAAVREVRVLQARAGPHRAADHQNSRVEGGVTANDRSEVVQSTP